MVGWKSRDKKNQKKSSTSIRIHLADLSQHPACQKQRRAGGKERLEGINTQSGKAPMRVEAKTERGQRDVRVEERGRARKVRR